MDNKHYKVEVWCHPGVQLTGGEFATIDEVINYITFRRGQRDVTFSVGNANLADEGHDGLLDSEAEAIQTAISLRQCMFDVREEQEANDR